MNGGLDYPKGNSYQVLSTSGQPTNSVLSGVESAETRRKPPRVDHSIRYFKGLLHNTLKIAGFEKSLRAAHNLKAAGSNPAPATSFKYTDQDVTSRPNGRLFAFSTAGQQ